MQPQLLIRILLIVVLLAKGTLPALAGPDSLRREIPPVDDTFAYIRYLNGVSAMLIQRGDAEQAVQYAGQALSMAKAAGDDEGASVALIHMGSSYASEGNSRKALSSFIRSLKLKGNQHNRRMNEKLYRGMAVALARLKQYPLALKYFYKSTHQQEAYQKQQQHWAATQQGMALQDTAAPEVNEHPGIPGLYDDLLDVTADDRFVVDKDTIMIVDGDKHAGAMDLGDLTAPFDDDKEAVAYGIMLHIKQPVAGTRKTFTGINTVGHMFITLTKFNADSGYVSRTFGFYPDKDYLLSATPLWPGSSSVFRNDAGRDWDEIMARFISKRKFNRILRMVMRYSRRRYNLNKNNCTDFGLVIAGIAGIRIRDTHGSWPLGSGNNPADAGQSVREGKIEQTGDGQLFVYPAPEKMP